MAIQIDPEMEYGFGVKAKLPGGVVSQVVAEVGIEAVRPLLAAGISRSLAEISNEQLQKLIEKAGDDGIIWLECMFSV